MRPTGELRADHACVEWSGGPVARTDYPTLLWMGECEPPLGVGSEVALGRYRLVVVAEEPETATVLVRRPGLRVWLEWAWEKLTGALKQMEARPSGIWHGWILPWRHVEDLEHVTDD